MLKALPLALVLPAFALGGCALLQGKQAPLDEFAVARNAPLVIPPDYTLTPPVAGTVSTTTESAQQQAIEALFGGPSPRSQTETTLLQEAGRDRALIGARSVAGDPATRVVDKGNTTRAILAAGETQSPDAAAQPPQ
ncbi:DUF3035 domain-containing protein [Sphingomonas mesophila]|uniref:DUF3035 domain-containing protein n=1 Tax=Sphingomonas mesophila TaxID=2303576 RepID=UPI000E568EB7|nr:DUF3035 domain-containing protein [Sphingomonas mesophila]